MGCRKRLLLGEYCTCAVDWSLLSFSLLPPNVAVGVNGLKDICEPKLKLELGGLKVELFPVLLVLGKGGKDALAAA